MLQAMTTAGPVPADALGIVLPHEHLLFDSSGWQTQPLDDHERWVAEAGLTLETVADLRRSPELSRENLIFWDEDLSARELVLFREAGGGTVVDCTLPEMKRDVAAAGRIAVASGVHVIVATGHYVAHMHTPEVAG
jgi:phosphotriesterase-related protein